MDKTLKILHKVIQYLSKIPREKFVYSFFVFLLFAVIYNLFEITVLNNDYYKKLADRQQTSQLKTPTSRWNIYSSNDKWKVLATSVYLNDLAIDPSVKWNKQKLWLFLTDIVYNEICYLKNSWECKKSLQRFLWVLEIYDFQFNEKYLKEKIWVKINDRLSKENVTSVYLSDKLTPEQAFELERANLKWVYVNWSNLYANPEELSDYKEMSKKLLDYTSYQLPNLESILQKRKLKYVPVLNKISIWTSELIKEKIAEETQAVKWWFIDENESIMNFIILNANQQRFYPEWTLSASILWFLDSDWNWNYWVEWYFDSVLRWKQSKSNYKKDVNWKIIDLDFVSHKDNLLNAWANITLTIDKNIQKTIEDIIDEDIYEYWANNINVVVMEPKTWNVIAMATHPRFDPNNPWTAYELVKVTPDKYPQPSINLRWSRVLAVDNVNWQEYIYNWKKVLLREISYEELDDPLLDKYVFANRQWAWVYRNHAVQDIYEPWSIFKPILMAVWIDSWEINRYDMYQDNWFVKIDEFTIKNVSSKCLWYNTYQNAMNFSCNVWMIRIAQAIWKNIYHKYLDSFGFWKSTWIELSWEVSWSLAPVESWSRAQLFTTSYWLWVWVTMIQMASAYSTIANWGIYYKPQIIKKIEFADGKVDIYKPNPTHRVLKESTSKLMTEVLVDWVEKWEAKVWKVEWYTLAWKTWTAQIAYKWKYETWAASTMASYAWFWPAEDPKFVIIVRVERPRKSEWWGATAWKTFNKISKYLLWYYKIPPKK